MEPQRQASSSQPQEGVGCGDGTARQPRPLVPAEVQGRRLDVSRRFGTVAASPQRIARCCRSSTPPLSHNYQSSPQAVGSNSFAGGRSFEDPTLHAVPPPSPHPPRNYHSPGSPHLHGNSHPFSVHGNTPQAGMSSSQSTPPAGILTPPAASETLAPLQRSESISRRASSGSMLGDSLYKDELQQMQRLVSVAQSRCGWVGG